MDAALRHPELPSCAACQRDWYTGPPAWQRKTDRHGRPVPRPPNRPPPCAGCPKGPTPGAGELTPRNAAVYAHYLRCKAVGRFPEDGWAEWHAGIVRGVEDAHARDQAERGALAVEALVKILAGRR